MPTFPEINRIVEKYGYYDKDYKDKKVLFEKLSCTKYNIVNERYKFKLETDEKEEKLYLCVYNLYDELSEKKSFVYLDSIKSHLFLKLNKLAIIKAFKKKIDKEECFRYYKIKIYNIKSFETLLDLLRKSKIDITLIARISKSGVNK